MVSLQCNNCVIHIWALQRRASQSRALYKSSFIYLFAYWEIRGAYWVFTGSAFLVAYLFLRLFRGHDFGGIATPGGHPSTHPWRWCRSVTVSGYALDFS